MTDARRYRRGRRCNGGPCSMLSDWGLVLMRSSVFIGSCTSRWNRWSSRVGARVSLDRVSRCVFQVRPRRCTTTSDVANDVVVQILTSMLANSSPSMATHLLPSERRALPLASPSSPDSPTLLPPPSLATKSSRNDLFSFDWAPVFPNLSSPRPSAPALRPLEIPPRAPVEKPTTRVVSKDAGLPTRIEFPLTPPIEGSLMAPGGGMAARMDDAVVELRQPTRLRLAPTKEYLLGEGRHASVYLASFTQPTASTSQLPSSSERHDLPHSRWTLCAAKRVLPDRESQLAGLGEAFILGKLASMTADGKGCPNILRLYGVKDERDGIESFEGSCKGPSRRGSFEPVSPPAIAINYPIPGSDFPPPLRTHSSSSMPSLAPPSTRPTSLYVRRRNPYSSTVTLVPPIGSPSLDTDVESFPVTLDLDPTPYISVPPPLDPVEVETRVLRRREKGPRYSEPLGPRSDFLQVGRGASDGAQGLVVKRRSSGRIASASAADVDEDRNEERARDEGGEEPRIILMVEYCPFGHVLSFVKSYPERMGKKRWAQWALELVRAIVWTHERGVLHCDIKPQNVLVRPFSLPSPLSADAHPPQIAQDLSLRLADFGMSLFLPSTPPTDPLGLGTPAYSSPELVHPPPSPFSYPTDIFSLGVTLSVLITGIEPYEGMRTVERMFRVGKGAYSEWAERRRWGTAGDGEGRGFKSLSRAGSMNSARSGRSRASSGAAAGGTPGLGVVASGRRSESVESQRSALGGGGDGWEGGRGWGAAMRAMKLLHDDEEGGEDELPLTPSSTTQLSFLPPSSPPLNALDLDDSDDTDSLDEDEPLSPGFGAPAYPDGTPVQYFLDGMGIVPIEVRELLQAMTSPRPGDRPTARQVLGVLEGLYLS
jgi:serine/threonine protein kinase